MAKEKSSIELRDEKKQLDTRNRELIALARKEERMLTDAENKEIAAAQVRMVEINGELLNIEEEDRGGCKRKPKEEFSFTRAIRNLAWRREQNKAEADIIEEASDLNRRNGFSPSDNSIVLPLERRAAFTSAVESALGVNIDQTQNEMLLPLENALVLSKAGARMMTGLTGDFYWPSYSGSSVSWEGENTSSPDGAGTFSKGPVFKPICLTAKATFSKQLLMQENKSVEAIVRQTLASAIAQKIESTAFSSAAHVDGVPDGLFQAVPAAGGAITWANVVKMETDLDTSNALLGNIAYIMHPALMGKAKTTVKDTSGAGGFVYQANGDGMLNGYNAFRTNNIPSALNTDQYGIVLANWADFFLAQWGGIEFSIDPYTGMETNMVKLFVNSYWNMGKVREASFVTSTMK